MGGLGEGNEIPSPQPAAVKMTIRWADLPGPARWLIAFAGLLAGPALVGWLTPLGPGNAVFLTGAIAILASLAFVRLGGDHTVVGRSLKGEPQWGVDQEKRAREIQTGLAIFALGVALWGVLLVAWLVR